MNADRPTDMTDPVNEAVRRLRPFTGVGGVRWGIEDAQALALVLDALTRDMPHLAEEET